MANLKRRRDIEGPSDKRPSAMPSAMPSPVPNPGWGPLSGLPGNPLMWVLILSELLVFAAFFGVFAWHRANAPQSFLLGQQHLAPLIGGLNTLVLLTSGLAAALAVDASRQPPSARQRRRTRQRLWIAMALGILFCVIKAFEYHLEFFTSPIPNSVTFFTFYIGLTGFHAAHVMFGLCLLAIAAWRPHPHTVETVAAFWHMVDLVWVLLYPLLYLVR
ncbi:cytochrome c oxidase subunit 3 [Halomonas sp. DP8Y7-3]|uniref:cytochrome c oxidase subunit 3 n=1 Tax=Halomonas sp. DP8Y7-3 TaxID=2859079 RepID=UPI0021BD48C4|nr:cytochrome c oxidase subunit 3 [Halomonas sp. DP8Y7-3]